MEIPYTVSARPDTGLWNPKIGIWLFLASEVMLFGGLFSGYIVMRLNAPEGYWPHGLLNVPVGTMNTAILIASSVTVVLAWAALKMRQFAQYKLFMGITILCGVLFLVVKLAYEWPQKFEHFGAFIKESSLPKYEQYLGNEYLKKKGLPRRLEISGHVHEVEIEKDGKPQKIEVHSLREVQQLEADTSNPVVAYEVGLDPVNAKPTDPESDRPHFFFQHPTDTIGTIKKEDIQFSSAFTPRHSTYFATYFTVTGLHGLHVLAGVLVFVYFWLPGAALYRTNPEHLANRVEVAGLFWHFVDLVWIFVFPLFYLL
jgi:cytochrome c oxidase subunit III